MSGCAIVELTRHQRRFLAHEAHRLNPVVMVGKEGASDGVRTAVRDALFHHELIKVRFQSFKDEKREIADSIATGAGAEIDQIVGNVATFYLQQEDPERRTIRLPNR